MEGDNLEMLKDLRGAIIAVHVGVLFTSCRRSHFLFKISFKTSLHWPIGRKTQSRLPFNYQTLETGTPFLAISRKMEWPSLGLVMFAFDICWISFTCFLHIPQLQFHNYTISNLFLLLFANFLNLIIFFYFFELFSYCQNWIIKLKIKDVLPDN